MLDPRTKLSLALFAGVLVVATAGPVGSLAQWGLVVLVVAGIKKIRAYLRWLRVAMPMVLFFGGVTWWTAGWSAGSVAALNLLSLISIFFVFFNTTTPEDLGNSLVKSGLPYSAAFVFSTSLQLVPVIGRKAGQVLDAQRSRGIPLEPGWRSLRHYPAFLGPLLIQAFQLAEELAEAMEARGFGRPGRTYLKDYRLKAVDWTAILGGLALLIVWLWLK